LDNDRDVSIVAVLELVKGHFPESVTAIKDKDGPTGMRGSPNTGWATI